MKEDRRPMTMKKKERRKKRLDRSIKVRSEGLYALSSWREMTYVLLPGALFLVGLLLLPLALDMYWQRVLCAACIYAMLALGFDFLASYVGLVCLGGALFIGTGGYISGLLDAKLALPLFISIPIAAIGGAVICTLCLLPCLRLRGIYFAIVSFMFPLFAVHIIVALNVFGGTEGISALSIFPNIRTEQYLALGIVLISLFAVKRLVKEDFGLILRGIKDNEQAVRASGINITKYKAAAVFIAALIGCFAGAYLSHLRSVAFCHGFLYTTHCRQCNGRNGLPGRPGVGCPYFNPFVRSITRVRTAQGGPLLPDINRVHGI